MKFSIIIYNLMITFFVNSIRMFSFHSHNLLFIHQLVHMQLTNAIRHMFYCTSLV